MLRRSLFRFAAAAVPQHTECLISVTEQRIARIVMNRPARKNALGRTMLAELQASIAFCAAPANGVRCVVLSSDVAGVFCAGADLTERKAMSPDEARAFVDGLRSAFSGFEDLPMPTIAAIEGAALGGGLELALAADLRVAGAKAKLGVPETALAIIPGAGGTQRLTKTVGLARAKELAFTATPVGAERAAAIQLVNEAVPEGEAVARALAIAATIAGNGPIAVAAAKAAIVGGFGLPRDAGMAVERANYEKVLVTEDRLEGLRAFAEKRKPVYQGK